MKNEDNSIWTNESLTELKLRLLSTNGNTRAINEEPLENTMPSASPLYNFTGINNSELDCPYRIPSIETQNEARYPNGYDSLQSLSAMADQSFAGLFSSQSPNYSTHIPVTSFSSTPQTVTSSPSPYFTSSDYTCMYNNTIAANQRRSCDASSDDSSYQEVLTKKEFRGSRDDLYNDHDQLLSWTRKHPENWNSEEVLDWLIYTGQEKGLNMSELRAEAFQNICGLELCRYGVEDFVNLEPKYGKSLYDLLKHLLTGLSFQKPTEVPDYQELSPYNNNNNNSVTTSVRSHYPSYHSMTNRKQENSTYNDYSNGEMYWKTERQEPMPCDVIDMGPYDFDVNDQPIVPPPAIENCGPEFEAFMPGYPNSAAMRTACCYPNNTFPQTLPRRRPGRPRNKILPGEEDVRAPKEKKGRPRTKNQHLWEFIYDCLINPAYNPQFLRWENQREGVFRFVQSEAVAQLWGGFKNNENMTYEKLSRAMRHYYKRGILERVEGRRLVYKFSRKAMDRAREKRQLSV